MNYSAFNLIIIAYNMGNYNEEALYYVMHFLHGFILFILIIFNAPNGKCPYKMKECSSCAPSLGNIGVT